MVHGPATSNVFRFANLLVTTLLVENPRRYFLGFREKIQNLTRQLSNAALMRFSKSFSCTTQE